MKHLLLFSQVLFLFSSFGKGVLCLTFDDRNFDTWTNAIPIFATYDAHVSFFPYGQLNEHDLECCKILSDAGHTIGTHTLGHVDVIVAMNTWWRKWLFYRRQLKSHVDSLGAKGVCVQSFAYPCSKHSAETDAQLGKRFRHLRGGTHYGYITNGVSLVQLDDVFFPASNIAARLYLPGIGVGDFYKSDFNDLKMGIQRAATNDEVLVFYSHAIVSDDVKDSQINMRLSELVRLLKAARENGVAIKGFDEL